MERRMGALALCAKGEGFEERVRLLLYLERRMGPLALCAKGEGVEEGVRNL
jgi:hypothetical protein